MLASFKFMWEKKKGTGSKGSERLTRNITNKNYHIYIDNFFTSPKLLYDLYKDGIYGCGTDRSGFPIELKSYVKNGFSKRGDSITFQSEILPNLTVSVWQDTKVVVM